MGAGASAYHPEPRAQQEWQAVVKVLAEYWLEIMPTKGVARGQSQWPSIPWSGPQSFASMSPARHPDRG